MDSAALTVEIHDVSPKVRAEVEALRTAVAGLGIERPVLLVVPNYEDSEGRRFDLREDPQMVAWLRREQARGAEIVQHGLTHRAPGPPPVASPAAK